MNKAILIFAWNRPNYLRICLDSLAAAGNELPVIVSYDGPEKAFLFHDQITNTITHECHVGNLWHVVRSIEEAFDLGFDEILFMDCDMIVRKDIFQRLRWEIPEGSTFIACDHFVSGHPEIWFQPIGNVVSRKTFAPLMKYFCRREWIGRDRFPGEPLSKESGYDGVFCRYMTDTGQTSSCSEIPLVGHIGLVGVDNFEHEEENKMFSGPPETWLSNAVRMFNPDTSPAFVPRGFKYE